MVSWDVMGVLSVMLTVAGALLFALAIVFLFAGNKLPADGAAPHRIKYGGLEISTSQVVMLVLVFATLTAVPFAGHVWLRKRAADHDHDKRISTRDAEIARLKAQLEDIRKTQLRIVATVSNRSGRSLADAQAYLLRVNAKERAPECGGPRPLVNGQYQCFTALNALGDYFELHIDQNEVPLGMATFTPVEQHVIIPLEANP